MGKRLISIMLTLLFIFCSLPVFSSARSRGDVDNDKKITAADARLTLRRSVGLEKFSKQQTSIADMDSDGKITAGDARRILRLSVGLPEENVSSNEYEILRSGNFYIEGLMSADGVSYETMTMAISGDISYTYSDFGGIGFGMLVDGDELYFIYPEKKSALHLSDAVLTMAGLSPEDYSSENIDFSSMPEFGKLKKERTETFRNISCTVYSYPENGGISEVYMDGNKLIRAIDRDADGRIRSDIIVNTLSASVPEEYKSIPSDYRLYKGMTGLMSFMSLLENVV